MPQCAHGCRCPCHSNYYLSHVYLSHVRACCEGCGTCGERIRISDAERHLAECHLAGMQVDWVKDMGYMLKLLHEAENFLPEWLSDESSWQTVLVNYHPPVVERVWRQWGENRVYLHRIFPCKREEALFHPHPWPSAMMILSGTYEMAFGFGSGLVLPPVATMINLSAGDTYEMVHPDSWHYVRPLGSPAMSLMVTGKPWHRPFSPTGRALVALTMEQAKLIFDFFRSQFLPIAQVCYTEPSATGEGETKK